MKNHLRERHISEGGDTEVTETVKPLRVHSLPLENFTVEVGMGGEIIQSVHSIHLLGEILLSVPKPL